MSEQAAETGCEPDEWGGFGCQCVGYTIRTDYGTGVEHDVDASSCPVHGGPPTPEPGALDPDALTVCIEHGAFVPCRRDGHHYQSQNPFWVKAVRDYQQSTVTGLTWEPASDYAARKVSTPTQDPA